VSSISINELIAKTGTELGCSSWRRIEQARIKAFADVTDDHQFIHVDKQRAAQTPIGKTIAHGFLTLSLLSAMVEEAVPQLENTVFGMVYGFDKIRFLSPVPVDSRIRGCFKLLEVKPRAATSYLIKHECTVEIENAAKPALIAEWIYMLELSEGKRN
jgi:acyl dehydratase